MAHKLMLPLLLMDTFMYLYHYKKETFIIGKKVYGHGLKEKERKKENLRQRKRGGGSKY